MKIIGLDVGEKRIGVARADSDTRISVPVGYINVDGTEWQQIANIAAENDTNFFVLGLPRSNEGNETAQSQFVRNFANSLAAQIPNSEIKFQDESLTSVMAEERLRVTGRAYEKGDIDAEAATIILQDFMEGFKEGDAKKKSKKRLKILTGLIIFVILGLLATGGALWVKDMRAKKRAEEYARIEAEMTAEVFNFTIKPGETIFDVKKSLIEAGYSDSEAEEALNANYNFGFLKNRPEGATLEGYLFGETHEFYKTATAKEVIETFLKGMEKVIKDEKLAEKYAAQGLSLHEGITLASVVQKESSAAEQPTVAKVFLNRLSYGIPLGSDVTVTYALDVVDPDRQTYTDNQAALQVDSCYNTRLYGGLPCGPISNPSITALKAVAEPTDTAYLYFLTGDDGLMYYSYTEAEHIQNIHSHCQNLCNVSL